MKWNELWSFYYARSIQGIVFLNASLVSVEKCKEKVVIDGIQIKLLFILIALALWI